PGGPNHRPAGEGHLCTPPLAGGRQAAVRPAARLGKGASREPDDRGPLSALLLLSAHSLPSIAHPRMVISIVSGGTPKVSARPFFASANVSGAPPVGAMHPGAGASAGAGMGSHFRLVGSMPISSREAYFTGFRSPFHASGILTRANSLNWIR